MPAALTALDFFAGSGLVTLGLQPHFKIAWANDICEKKAAVYRANFGERHFKLGSIADVNGRDLPAADLSWASFPCQDLSLAGNLSGMRVGSRSGLFWQWLRVLDEMPHKPPVLCVENVVGFLVAGKGRHFRDAYYALRERGYAAGAFVLDAIHFVPQSRPRSFLVAVQNCATDAFEFEQSENSNASVPPGTPAAVLTARAAAADPEWIWWTLPTPRQTPKKISLSDLIDRDAEVHSPEQTQALLAMLSPRNRRKLDDALAAKKFIAGAGYKRIRTESGARVQRLEIRFDGAAGCLRTPNGGSSRQLVLIVENGKVSTRLLTVREAARLMGAGDDFKLPGRYNAAYRAMGDAVAVPVTAWLAEHLLAPLAKRARKTKSVAVQVAK